jgi:hypothetical protein
MDGAYRGSDYGIIAMASQVLLSISKDEAERARLMSEFKGQMDYQSKIGYARREGHREGRREEQQEIARKLKARGRPLTDFRIFGIGIFRPISTKEKKRRRFLPQRCHRDTIYTLSAGVSRRISRVTPLESRHPGGGGNAEG